MCEERDTITKIYTASLFGEHIAQVVEVLVETAFDLSDISMTSRLSGSLAIVSD